MTSALGGIKPRKETGWKKEPLEGSKGLARWWWLWVGSSTGPPQHRTTGSEVQGFMKCKQRNKGKQPELDIQKKQKHPQPVGDLRKCFPRDSADSPSSASEE